MTRTMARSIVSNDHLILRTFLIGTFCVISLLSSGKLPTPAVSSARVYGIADPNQIDIRYGSPPKIDGVVSDGEWDDTGVVNIMVGSGVGPTVRYKHDGSNLYFVFTNISQQQGIRVPEVTLDMNNDKSSDWHPDDWWFHASGRDCQSRGRHSDYSTCAKQSTEWESNNVQGMEFPQAFEMRVPFTTIGLDPSKQQKIGIGFNITDTKSVWNFWPSKALLGNPSTWGEATSSDMWRKK